MITGKLRGALYLGLDGENVARLTAGEPIRIPAQRMAALGFEPMTVVIHYGRTQDALITEVAEHGERIVNPEAS